MQTSNIKLTTRVTGSVLLCVRSNALEQRERLLIGTYRSKRGRQRIGGCPITWIFRQLPLTGGDGLGIAMRLQ
jgi:hypothetical protein